MLLNRDKNGGIYFQAWKNLLESTPKGFWLYNQNVQECSRYNALADRMEKKDKISGSNNFLLETSSLSSNVVNPGAVKTNLQKFNQMIPWKDARNQKTESQNETKFRSTPTTLAKHSQPYLLTEGKKCFQCPQCKYATDRKNNLKRHLGTMHRDCGKLLQCCDSIFSSKAALRDHIFAVHKAGYRCQHCGRSFCRKALLKRHEIGHDVEDEPGNRSTSFRKQIFQSDSLTLRGYNDFSSNLSSPVEQTSMAFQIQKIPNVSCTSSMRADMNRKENVFYQTVNIFQHLEQQFLIKNRQIAHTAGLSNSQNYQTISNYNFFKTETSDSHDSDTQHKSDPPIPRDFGIGDKDSQILPKKHRKLFLSRRLQKIGNNTFVDEENLKECPKFGEQKRTNGRTLLGDNRRLCRNVYRCSVCKCEFDNQMKLVKHIHK